MRRPDPSSLAVLAMSLLSGAVLIAPIMFVGRVGGSGHSGNGRVTGMVVAEFGQHVVPVDLMLEWSKPFQVPAPAWGGALITKVAIEPGRRIVSGESVLSIDGIDRVAIVADEPPHRMIRSGDSGADVEALRDLISGMELGPVGDTGGFGWTDLLAVRRLAEQLGVPGAARVNAFDPAWTVWVGPSQLGRTAGKIDLLAGHPAPSLGETVFETQQRLVGVVVKPRDSEARLRTEQGVKYEIELAGSTRAIDAFTVDLRWVREVAAHGGLPVGSESIPATIRATPDSNLPIVPASAIHVSADGGACVIVVDRNTDVPTPVEVIGNQITGVFVSGLHIGDEIVIGGDNIVDGCDGSGA